MSLSKLTYLVLFFIASWSAYYLYEKSATDVDQVAPSTEAPMFTGSDLYNTSYDINGLRNYKIHSTSLEHYAQTGKTTFYQPRLIVYREGTIDEWVVTSDTGVLDKENVLTLNGNVVARNTLPDSSFDKLTTDTMQLNLKTKDFSSDTKVTMTGPQFINIGNAMKGNFDANVATLFNQVQGKYETLTP
ncbi:LPS export ABC transporter periplasmic protein LptC [Vibrio rumoiensis]|uniref:Lipopolysaccharide export system protein LptC n=1 Tax=Vibrio rumoiensis 1S-45 TaxID=1188252 RepID=A0A1E5E539_9VIBR|nr:LPS export ABC transporter periplasmic protein LptC [Vibrio rumoiensis]OEF28446.1 LPS export ABC transporter periplasmic protein LptC [Vibrio rumoiensis 1S-45]